MQVDITVVISIVTGIIGAAAWLHVRSVQERERETEKKLDALEDLLTRISEKHAAAVLALGERMTIEEKATIRQDGEVALVKQSHDNLAGDMDEVKKMLNQILAELRGRPGGYQQHQSGGYGGMTVPRKDPLK